MYFEYGEKELEYLKSKDKNLCLIIEKIGFIKREINEDIFSSLVRHIIGQQISSKAQITIYNRLLHKLGKINAISLCNISNEELQTIGISFRKVAYIKEFAKKVKAKELDIGELHNLDEKEIIKKLSQLDGIGEWTAQMLLIFSLKKRNILSYKDLAIIKGLKILYGHKKIDKKLFLKYEKRYSPYATIASFYLWALSNGEINEAEIKELKAQKSL